jgi:hypothetical protein
LLALASAPFPAFAAVSEITIDGNTYKVGGGGAYEKDPATEDFYDTGWAWTASSKTLTLGVGGLYSTSYPIEITASSASGDTIKLVLDDDVAIDTTSGGYEGIRVNDGSLAVEAVTHTLTIASHGTALSATGDIAIKSGTVKATSSNNAAIRSGGNVLITGGTVTATGSGGYGIYATGVDISGGKVTVVGDGDGIAAYGDIDISGGTVDATGGDSEGDFALNAGGVVKISGGTVTTGSGEIGGTLKHTGGYLNGLDKDGNPPPTPGGGSGGCDAGFGAGALLAAAGLLAAGKKRRGR